MLNYYFCPIYLLAIKQQKGGFGSTDERNVLWTTQITKVQPKLKIQLAGRSIFGLMDTGSDTTIINLKEWPSSISYQIIP